MIWGEDQEIKVLEDQNKICSAMFDKEKSGEYEWDKETKTQVAEAASVQVSDVEDLLGKYKQLTDFHQWLLERRKNELPMPESQDDLMNIYRIERPAFLFKKEDSKTNYSRRQMRYSMRRHYT